jgi:transcriptional antiterminator NusG
VRVKNGKEKDAALAFKEKAEFKDRNIFSVLVIENVMGYIFVEGNKHDIESTCSDVSQYRAKILGKTSLEDLNKHLEPKPTIQGVNVGDIVEIISGPFKGSRAKIVSMIMTREEITVELLDSRITIPIVIHADYVRKLESGDADNLNSSSEE